MTGLRRRDFLKAAAVASTTAVVAGATQATNSSTDGSGGDWTTYRGNAGRTGATDATGPGRNVGTEWSMDPGGGLHTVEPVVDDDALYLAVTTTHGPSVSEGYVAACDPATGDERWRKDDISRPGTPTVGGGTVYFDTAGTESAAATGFFAVDAETGETKWHQPSSSGLSGALVADGRLYCKAAGDACELDPGTGEIRWRTGEVGGGVCYADGTLFYGAGVALDAADGTVRWDVSGAVGSEWDLDAVQTVVDGQTYGTLYRQSKEVQARSAADGTLQWSHSLDSEEYWRHHRLAVTDGCVLFRLGDAVHALDAKTGESVWTYEADVQLTSNPTVASGTVYVGGRTAPGSDTGDAAVVALDVASGERAWRHVFGSWEFEDYGPAAATPVVDDGRVFAATYPEGSTTDYEYTEHADLYAIGSDGGEDDDPATTTSGTTTTPEPSTTSETSTTAEPTSTTSAGTTTADAPSRTTAEPTSTTTNAGTDAGQSTTSAGPASATATGSTTATDGQVGFGVLSALGGMASVGTYLRTRRGDGD